MNSFSLPLTCDRFSLFFHSSWYTLVPSDLSDDERDTLCVDVESICDGYDGHQGRLMGLEVHQLLVDSSLNTCYTIPVIVRTIIVIIIMMWLT